MVKRIEESGRNTILQQKRDLQILKGSVRNIAAVEWAYTEEYVMFEGSIPKNIVKMKNPHNSPLP